METVFTGIIVAILMMGCFFAGIYVAGILAQDAEDEAQYRARKAEYYREAGVRTLNDPLPYVAPPVRRRRRIPHLAEIDRRLKSGERGTVRL